jgi:hypothetical protein
MQQRSAWSHIDKELAMWRYLMISLLTVLTIILLTRALVGAAQSVIDKTDASEYALSQE